jgi:hypothetical protein
MTLPPFHTEKVKDPNVWVPQKLHWAWEAPIDHPMSKAQGKRRSLMQPQPLAAGHPFFPALHQWGSHGVTVDCGLDWQWDTVLAAVARGPHRSALDPENIALVHEDVQYQVDAGFSKIVLWEDLNRLKPRTLKISSIAVVPQNNRRGRLILDLPFPVYPERTKTNPRPYPIQAGVNETTIQLAPQEPVREIGNVLRRGRPWTRSSCWPKSTCPTGFGGCWSKKTNNSTSRTSCPAPLANQRAS